MRVCIDPGHGYENKSATVYDPGAVVATPSGPVLEATVNLEVALMLERVLKAMGHETMLTRRDTTTSCPVKRRATFATNWGADVMISLHCNAATPRATGVEVQFRDREDQELADILLPRLMRALTLPSHENDQRDDLAVLWFKGPVVLIEMGFLTNDIDRAALLSPQKREAFCNAVAESLEVWRPRRAPAPHGAVPAPKVCETCRRPL